jgi:hypothetical protein
MGEQQRPPYERLLQEWAFRREMVNFYCRALWLLTPDDPNALERWRGLSRQLTSAEQALRQANAQLRHAQPEQTLKHPA